MEKVKASNHDSYNTFSVISFVLPFVGLILGAIMLTKDDKLDKKLGEHAIVVSVFGFIVWAIAWVLYVNYVATNTLESMVY